MQTKTIVLSSYGSKDSETGKYTLEDFQLNLCGTAEDAQTLSSALKSLPLETGKWVNTLSLSENTRYKPQALFPLDFPDALFFMPDKDIQRFLVEITASDLAKALKGAPDKAKEKIYSNMSRKAAGMLKEDIDLQGPLPMADIQEARNKFSAILQTLIDKDEIRDPRIDYGKIIN